MRIKSKPHKNRTRTFIITNGILHTSRCTAMKKETSLWNTFFNGAKIVLF
ncbi:MAG: hypothetical protein HFH66_17495 [Lachnospiraceae bacterium]|nr:hypothetical protein [Lachnospiraceae bacterium]